jgi:uncharacterized tellurite resistance protein B-like protein
MLERMLGWFGEREGEAPDASVARECTRRAVSLLLVAAARADGAFTAAEAREIAQLVSSHFALPADETAELVAAAASERSGELYPATRVLVAHLDRPARREVLGLMWRVVFSDGRLEAHEEALMRRAAKLLDIPHRELIDLKLTARAAPPADD